MTQPAPQQAWPRIGAFSYHLSSHETDRLAPEYAQLGLSSVQISGGILRRAIEQPDTIAPLRASLDAQGISVAGLGGYKNIVAPDEQHRREGIEFLKRCLEFAPAFGTPVVATETGTRNRENDWIDAPENTDAASWDLLCAAIEELLAVAERHKTILAIEGYVSNIVRTPDQLESLLQRFPSPHLQVVLDPFNYLSKDLLPQSERVVADFLQRFEQHFVLAHLKDVSAEGAEQDTPEFGTGVFSYQVYLDFLRTRRPDLPIILEHLPWDHMPAAIARLHHML